MRFSVDEGQDVPHPGQLDDAPHLGGAGPGDAKSPTVVLRAIIEIEQQAYAGGVQELELVQVEQDALGIGCLGAAHLQLEPADDREVQLADKPDALAGLRALAPQCEATIIPSRRSLVPL